MQKTIVFDAYENYIWDDETRSFLIDNSWKSVVVHWDDWLQSVVSRYEKSKQFTISNSLFMSHEINESHDSHSLHEEHPQGSSRVFIILGLIITITIWVFFLNTKMKEKTNIEIQSKLYIEKVEQISSLFLEQKMLKQEREKIRISLEKNISEVKKIEQEIDQIKARMLQETESIKK